MDTITAENRSVEELLGEVADEFFQQLEQGNRPDLEEYAQRYPAIAEQIRLIFPALELVGDSLSSGGIEALGPAASGRLSQHRLGDFQIVRELGRGGMGVVYEAQQISMGRQVALKVLPFAALADETPLRRFKNEVRAVATLEHPNIVSVYCVGEERGVHYYAMQLIRGRSLAETIEQLAGLKNDRQPLDGDSINRLLDSFDPSTGSAASGDAPTEDSRATVEGETEARGDAATTDPEMQVAVRTLAATVPAREFYRSAAELGIQAASALAHAHEYGILHRDIKPANLLLDASGKLYITDFGLARVEADAGVTMSGQMIGTLRYMSPEQALTKGAAIDHRSDIYSLGMTLYELLALRPAFRSTNRQEILAQIAFEEPQKLSRLVRSIPGELETIVAKAIEKSPEDRYASAAELADDLRAFLDDRPITARPPTLVQRLGKWSRRHVAVVWTAAALLLVLALGSGASTVAITASRDAAERDRIQAEHDRESALEQRNIARQNQYYAEMTAGQTQVNSGNPGGLYTDLIKYLPLSGEVDLRGWEWYYLMSKCRSEERTILHPGLTPFAAWSPDGRHIATPGAIWEAETGTCIQRISTSYIKRENVAWSPDATKVAWAMVADENAFYVLDLKTDQVSRFGGHQSSVWSLVWSADGSQIVSGSLDHTIKFWDVQSQQELWIMPTTDVVRSLDWHADTNLLAVALSHGVQVWDMQARKKSHEAPIHGAEGCVSWHPDGKKLAICQDGSWLLLRTEDWKVTHKAKLARSGTALSFSPDGSLIAVSHGELVSVYDSSGKNKVAQFTGHLNPVHSLSWHPGGRRLISSDETREIKLWDLDRSDEVSLNAEIEIESVAWLDDHKSLVALDKAGASVSIRVGDGLTKRRKMLGVEVPAAVSPDRKLVAYFSEDEHTLTVRDVATGATRSVLAVDDDRQYRSAAFAPDGLTLLVQSEKLPVLYLEAWQVEQEKQLWEWQSERPSRASGRPLRQVTWNRSGTRFAAMGVGDVGEDGSTYWRDHLHVFDAKQGTRYLKHLPHGRDKIASAAWDADGSRLAIGTADGRVEILDAQGEKQIFSTKLHRDGLTALAWHPTGNRLAVGTHDGRVKLVSSKEGKVLLSFAPSQSRVVSLAWSQDGQRLAAATSEGKVDAWDASTAYELASAGARRGELAWAYYDHAQQGSKEAYSDSLREFLRYAPDDLGFWEARGDAHAELGDFERAVEEFAKGIGPQLQYSYSCAYSRAAALLGAGRVEDFQEACAELAETFRDSPVPSNRGRVAWITSLASNPQVNSATLVAMAKADYDANAPGDRPQLTLGSAFYRNGQYEEANRLLTKLATKLESDGHWTTDYEAACAKYFLSMSRASVGHKFQSQRLLDEANDLAERYLEREARSYWEKIVALEVLREEAVAAVHD